MKNRIVRVLLVLTFVFTWLGFHSNPVQAAGCSGSACTGKDPSAMGCSASTAGALAYISDNYGVILGTVETRVSGTSSCNAKWARVYNTSGIYQWVAADLYCGTPKVSCQFQRSSAKIASSSTVGIYTPMQAYASTSTKSCGVVRGDPGPITSVPMGTNNCTSNN
ncbi:MAG: DUF2690 domain-containing protein [Chloroflexi bacterium]|nr:DUF2690 domain-containing protein [Chloroflexota bacterium]